MVDEWSCAVRFQAAILWLPLLPLRKGSQDLLSYTRRGAIGTVGRSSGPELEAASGGGC
jgi:hypothetical protein